jgi:hypothetical protein
MATALQYEPLKDESALLETALRTMQLVSAERVLAFSRFGTAAGREFRVQLLLEELAMHTAALEGISIPEMKSSWELESLQAADALEFLEESVVALRVDLIHKVVPRD